MGTKFSHVVDVDADTRKVVVYRLYADGRRELFTLMDLPVDATSTTNSRLDEFCRMLGENLLLDSPIARSLLRL